MATFLNSFVNHARVVKIANMAQLVNVIAPIFSDEKGLFLQTIYHPLRLFANNTKGTSLQLYVDSPTYKSKRFDGVAYIDASAGYENGGMTLNIVNRHKDLPVDADVLLEDKQFAGPVHISEVNGPDIKSENNFETAPVGVAERTAATEGNSLHVRLAPHSFTMLKAGLN